MSMDAVKKFLEALRGDSKLLELAQKIDLSQTESALAELAKLGASRGFSFTTEEAKGLLTEIPSIVSDQELERIAGGGGDTGGQMQLRGSNGSN